MTETPVPLCEPAPAPPVEAIEDGDRTVFVSTDDRVDQRWMVSDLVINLGDRR